MERTFRLEPFPTPASSPRLEIAGRNARTDGLIAIRYFVSGRVADLVFPGTADPPARRHNLWQATCLELFLAPKDSPRYWELNLSPAGHWNIYSFESYRVGMREEKAITSLPFTVHRERSMLSLELKLDLDAIVGRTRALEGAISAVTKEAGGEPTYWALTHCAPKPDFHLRKSFILRL